MLLVFPLIIGYCDVGWWSLSNCRLEAAVNHALPFNCPADYAVHVNPLNMADDPLHMGLGLE